MGSKPQRIQRKRVKGWRLPPNTVIIDRTSRYGNPFPIGKEGPMGRKAIDAEGAVGFFEQMLRDPQLRSLCNYPSDEEIQRDLGGKDLACTCKEDSQHCHGQPLIRIANANERTHDANTRD